MLAKWTSKKFKKTNVEKADPKKVEKNNVDKEGVYIHSYSYYIIYGFYLAHPSHSFAPARTLSPSSPPHTGLRRREGSDGGGRGGGAGCGEGARRRHPHRLRPPRAAATQCEEVKEVRGGDGVRG